MKRLIRAMQAAIRAFSYEMKRPKPFKMTENRQKLMRTWMSIDYADMWRPEGGK